MKNLVKLFAAILLILPLQHGISQEKIKDLEKELEIMENNVSPSVSVSDTGIVIEEDSGKKTVTVNEEEIVITEEGKDTTRIKLGGKGIEIIEGKDGTTRIEIKELNREIVENDDSDTRKSEKKTPKKPKFEGHWSGVELGLNNFVNNQFNSSLDPSIGWMDLNTNRSLNVNVNIIQYDIGFGTTMAGLVTGMGFEFSNYIFDGNNSIQKDASGQIVEYIPAIMVDPGSSVMKSKLSTSYLTIPLLLEFQIPTGKKRIHISGGVIGGAKIGSSTKIVYKDRGSKQKEKVKDDFNLASLRYGYTIRAGYRSLNLFANYYPVSLFEKGKGPELYPYSIGLKLVSF